MKIFMVGGAVRDELLGLPVQDRDYVVVNASPEHMLALGYRAVGKDFPVFLHPKTHEEYALARTERKSGHGYKGFSFFSSPTITLEEDLQRRDLTINAIAKAADGTLIDPFNGAADIKARILRHVGPAFSEDPVRILRVSRFAARYPDFSIAQQTMSLMNDMVSSGEVDHLVSERVWQELSKGLMEKSPARMIEVLRECGALKRLIPELDALFGVPQRADYHPEVDTGQHTLLALGYAAQEGYGLPVRFAVLTHDLGKGATPVDEWPFHHKHEERGIELTENVCWRLKAPSECKALALLVARYHGLAHRAEELRASTIVNLLKRTDALRRPERFLQFLEACNSDYHGRSGWENKPRPYSEHILLQALEAMRSIDAALIASQCNDASKIPARLHEKRVNAVREILSRLVPSENLQHGVNHACASDLTHDQ